MLSSFESKENATVRKKNEKDYSDSLQTYSFHREKLLREAQNSIDNEISINWSELEKSCNLVYKMGINPKIMGQATKDFIMKSAEISGKHKSIIVKLFDEKELQELRVKCRCPPMSMKVS